MRVPVCIQRQAVISHGGKHRRVIDQLDLPVSPLVCGVAAWALQGANSNTIRTRKDAIFISRTPF
jgi:hypothetical protein